MNSHRFFAVNVLLVVILSTLVTLGGCETLTPTREAESIEQRAFALYGTFVIYQEAAARSMSDPQIPDSVKREAQQIDARAAPIASSLAESTATLSRLRREFEEGAASEGELLTAIRSVERWTQELAPLIARLISTVGG